MDLIRSRYTTQFNGYIMEPKPRLLACKNVESNLIFMPKRGNRSRISVEMWQPDPIFMPCGNLIQIKLPKCSNLNPIYTPKSQSQVRHQDPTTKGYSWHTIIQLSLFIVRVINNETFTYKHALQRSNYKHILHKHKITTIIYLKSKLESPIVLKSSLSEFFPLVVRLQTKIYMQ